MIEFIYNAKPMGRGAAGHRIIYGEKGYYVQTEYSQSFYDWEAHLKTEAKLAMRKALIERPMPGLVRVNCIYYFERPQNHYGTDGTVKDKFLYDAPSKNPIKADLDRAIAYALEEVVFERKTNIVDGTSAKRWAKEGRVEIQVIPVFQGNKAQPELPLF